MRQARTSPRPPRRRRTAAALLAGLIGASGLGLALLGPGLWSPDLVEIAAPGPGEVRGNVAVEVFLHFPRPEQVRPETLRVRLNGADVTGGFVTASNGAYGDVVLLVDGDNLLEASVFGRSPWGGDRLVEHTAELRFRVRRPIDRNWG